MSEVVYECKHVMRPTWDIINDTDDDIHYAKIIEHHPDGTKVPTLKKVVNYKRPFWVTQDRYRDHKQKKSWEDIRRLRKYTTTEKDMAKSISRALGGWNYKSMRELRNNPYIYGTTVPATTIIKADYNNKPGVTPTAYSSVCLDIETSIKDGRILMTTTASTKVINTYVRKDFLPAGTTTDDIMHVVNKYLGSNIDGIQVCIHIMDTEEEVIKDSIATVHAEKPDFLAIWNMDYDINVISDRAEHLGINPADIFSDPSIPPNERFYRYMEGSRTLITTEGVERPKAPSMQWHSVKTPASFYILDMMCVYRRIIHDGNELAGGYGLDNVLKKEKLGGKLEFNKTDKYSGVEWHSFMQDNYPIEYITYNIWDSLSMVKLESKLNLMAFTFPTFAGYTEYSQFGSSSKVAISSLYFYLLRKDHVLGTQPIEDKNDPKLLGTKGWIVTLPAAYNVDNGLPIVEEMPHYRSNMRAYVFDSDAVASYPRNTMASNCGKDTTARELLRIEGIEKETLIRENLNVTMSTANILEYCNEMFNLPGPTDLLELWDTQ